MLDIHQEIDLAIISISCNMIENEAALKAAKVAHFKPITGSTILGKIMWSSIYLPVEIKDWPCKSNFDDFLNRGAFLEDQNY